MANRTYDQVINGYKLCKSHRESTKWDEIAKKALAFYLGNQWESQHKAILRSQNRAPSTFNMILPVVDLIVGHQIETEADLVIKPVDRFADPYIAHILTSGMKSIGQTNDIQFENKMQVQDGLLTGVGVKELWMDMESNFDGDMRIQQGDPWEIYLDCYFKHYDYSDAKVLYRKKWMRLDDIKRVFGKKIANQLPDIEEETGVDYAEVHAPVTPLGYSDDYGNRYNGMYGDFDDVATQNENSVDRKNNMYRVIEEYRKEYEENEYYFDSEQNTWLDAGKLAPEEYDLIKDLVVTKSNSYIRLVTIIADRIVQDKPLKEKEFFHLFNFYFPYFINGKYMGVVENLFYPQEEVNKRHSTIVHILNSIANSGIFYEDGAFSKEIEANLENELARNGVAIKMEDMYDEDGHRKYEFITPHDAPATYMNLIAGEKEDIKYISGAGDAIQGISRRAQSGTAKNKEIEQSAVRLSGIIENFRKSQRLQGRAILFYIQKYYTEERMMRIVGENMGENDQEVTLNKYAYGQIFNNTSVGLYDVYFGFEGKTATERERIYYRLIEMSNTVPQFADIIGKRVIQYMDIPDKDAIIAEWEQRQQLLQQQAQMGLQQGMGTPNRGGIQSSPRPSASPRRQPTAIGV